MLSIKTETGSTYYVDTINKRACRAKGKGSPTGRIGSDNTWRSFVALLSTPEVGAPLSIVWRVLDDGTNQATVTSRIVDIEAVPLPDDDGSSKEIEDVGPVDKVHMALYL